ncbi:MAG: aminotransferase class I/II-fold pyridoxal phosphate-dependent enzyme [Proteobacteria bacterium]|nr:aminotransferase class I/II-fold pyridoxal phosphate-dependent enzyme [Pseudomonadota bacterium]MBU1060088.1 aminotransferase class I/II-fold pyridoxal phosphate-dependent enzyme [Pseudomonadota bacterium]
MTTKALEKILRVQLAERQIEGILKGRETVICGVKGAQDNWGPRLYLEGQGGKEFLQMNSNSYLGLSRNRQLIEAEEAAASKFGTGPGGVRFISGTYQPHVDLEKRLAAFHHRQSAMLFSAAYSAVMAVLPALITSETIVISDALNHNCIINGIRLSRPAAKEIYAHLDMGDLEVKLQQAIGAGKRVLVVSDGIFSMRGEYAPLDKLVATCERYEENFGEGIITLVDDSHGVGAFGQTGRGTEEYTDAKVDLLVATLGKALGVNGGYVTGSSTIIEYLRETAPFYIYSNPVTPAEAAVACKSLDILEGPEGGALLERLRSLTKRLQVGLMDLGLEVLCGEHPIVPLLVRDTEKTARLVEYLFQNSILATGLKYPVVPRGDEEIRFQVSAEHTAKDIDFVLTVLRQF